MSGVYKLSSKWALEAHCVRSEVLRIKNIFVDGKFILAISDFMYP